MTSTLVTFFSRAESYPGERLRELFLNSWPRYQHWFRLGHRSSGAAMGRRQLLQHMPELLAVYDALCQRLSADEEVAAFLSLYNPPGFRAGCSQVAWNRDRPALLRNYDFPLSLCDRQLLYSRWNGTAVIAMTDCLWGVLDGINEHGLAVSLAYGGQPERGDGFGVTLVLRYLLEVCQNVADARAVLARIPLAMPYNVTMIDRGGDLDTVALSPGAEPEFTRLPFATNHQSRGLREDLEAVADSSLRESFLSTRMSDPAMNPQALLSLFLSPPLLRRASEWRGWGTVYSARYDCVAGSAELHWPDGQVLRAGFSDFAESSISVSSPAFL